MFLHFTKFIEPIFFVFSDRWIEEANTSRHRLKTYIKNKFQKRKGEVKALTCRAFDEYLNINDDFKTSLLWLSIFTPTIQGVAYRIPINYRMVHQNNYFQKVNDEESIHDAVLRPDGDTFQNSPLKLVFFSAFHTKESRNTEQSGDVITLSSISQVNVNAKDAGLPSIEQTNGSTAKKTYSNMTIENEKIQCLWPSEDDLAEFLFLLGFHPYKNLGAGIHDFPWTEILSLFNDNVTEHPSPMRTIYTSLGFNFLYKEELDSIQLACRLKDFIQFVSPISVSATEGDHRIELSNRLLYGRKLKGEAPFLDSSSDFIPLPFNSTVYKPIPASVFLPAENGSPLSGIVTRHLKQLSRKTASQKQLYIQDSWRSLYQSILNSIDMDDKFLQNLYSTQEEFYQSCLKTRQEPDCKARVNRDRLSKVIAEVMFSENPTASLALNNAPEKATKDAWINAIDAKTWTTMDSNPFSAVSTQDLSIQYLYRFLSYKIYRSDNFCISIIFFSIRLLLIRLLVNYIGLVSVVWV